MDLDKNDSFFIEQECSGAHKSVVAVHAPHVAERALQIVPVEGTGGMFVPHLLIDTSGSPYTVTIQKPDSLLVILDKIERTFGITRKDVAQICLTTRKTIYNWLEGKSEPRDANLQRLFMLTKLADDWEEFGYTSDRTKVRRPVIDEQSVLDLLSAERLDNELILFAGSRLAMAQPITALENPFTR